MSSGFIIALLSNGLCMGMVYALLAMGLVLLIRAVGLLNFAQGDILALGAFIAYTMLVPFELPMPIAFLFSLLGYALVGLIFMACVYWPVRNSSFPSAVVISTMGASIVIRELIYLIWGSLPLTMPAVFQAPGMNGRSVIFHLGDATISAQYIVMMVVGILALLLVHTIFDKLYCGRIMEAASQDPFAARVIGISIFATTAMTYMISFALAGAGGFMIGSVFSVSMSLGSLLLFAFSSLVIGGMGSIKGAVVGGLMVGVLEAFASAWFQNYKTAAVFVVLIFFLLFKPHGLFKGNVDVKV